MHALSSALGVKCVENELRFCVSRWLMVAETIVTAPGILKRFFFLRLLQITENNLTHILKYERTFLSTIALLNHWDNYYLHHCQYFVSI